MLSRNAEADLFAVTESQSCFQLSRSNGFIDVLDLILNGFDVATLRGC